MIDSGSKFTYLVEEAYNKVREEIVRLVGPRQKKGYVCDGGMADMCFDGNAIEIGRLIGNMVFEVEKGMEIVVEKERVLTDVGRRVHCIGIGRCDGLGATSNIIGNIHQQNQRVEFDLANRRVGFGKADCSRSIVKVEQVTEEAESLKQSLDRYFLRNQKRTMEAKERAELLGRANGESHILRIFDEEAQARQSVRSSARMLEEASLTGEAILSAMSGSRERLKNAQRKALDVLNTVGLSNSVLRLIERRHRVDNWIKYAGMILTLVIVFIIWRWTR
ncbi:hypothetical protein CMV_013226 [Castanea mollissima]|uniref:Peptidase A1 domain-containing protein n=1 Tax=Castanea mollissima TaxID=60419 RepID=A0A8J4QZT2_9ROSI|nr:hypothetical protein CMV_013226 [Castanea mollissima]